MSLLIDNALIYTNNSDNEVYHYEYDTAGKLVKTTIENGESTRLITYQHHDNRSIAEIQEKEFDVRNVQYFNEKKQVVEE